MKKWKRKMFNLFYKLHKKYGSSYFGEITGEKHIKNYRKKVKKQING